MSAACYLCGSSDWEKLGDSIRGGWEAQFKMRPYRCRACSLVFLAPLMTEEEEADFYSRLYRDLYHGQGYDLTKFHLAGRIDHDRRAQRLIAEGRVRGRVLDVGTSTGYFLEALRPHVTTVVGVEPDEQQRGFGRARGLEIYASLDDVPREGGGFDLITLFHVLEHVRDPAKFLAEVAERLAPGGVLIVEVPNVDDVLLSRYQIPEFATFYWHPAHSYYFSAATLGRVAERAGLQAQIEGVQRYPLANHLGWLRDRKPSGLTASLDFLSPETNAAYAADLCRHLISDTLWMVAQP